MSRRSRRRFESLVADALDELPGWVRVRTAENVHGWTEATAVLDLPDPKSE